MTASDPPRRVSRWMQLFVALLIVAVLVTLMGSSSSVSASSGVGKAGSDSSTSQCSAGPSLAGVGGRAPYWQSHDYDRVARSLLLTTGVGRQLILPDAIVDNPTGSTTSAKRTYQAAGLTLAERTGDGGDGFVTFLDADLVTGTASSRIATGGGLNVNRRYTTPIGGLRGSSTSRPAWRGFLDEPFDDTAGWSHFGVRDYSPEWGIFTTPDLLLAPLLPAQHSAYSFSANDPINKADPDGRCYQDYSTGQYVGVGCGGAPFSWTEQHRSNSGKVYTTTEANTSTSNRDAYRTGSLINGGDDPNDRSGPLINWAAVGKAIVSVGAGLVAFAGCTAATGGAGAVVGFCEGVGGAAGAGTAAALNGDSAFNIAQDSAMGFVQGASIPGGAGIKGITRAGKAANSGFNAGLDATKLNMTRTVESHIGEYAKDGTLARPYADSRLTIQNVMDSVKPTADPGGAPGALRWDAPGTMNGSNGTWELVVDPRTNTVLHFMFRGAH